MTIDYGVGIIQCANNFNTPYIIIKIIEKVDYCAIFHLLLDSDLTFIFSMKAPFYIKNKINYHNKKMSYFNDNMINPKTDKIIGNDELIDMIKKSTVYLLY